MRKGSQVTPWTVTDERWLRETAGTIPEADICRHLKRSRSSVEAKAHRLGISLRYMAPRLVWCDSCATWRTEVDADGRCPVCKLREQNAGHRERNAQAWEQLSALQRQKVLEAEAEAEEKEERRRLQQEGNRLKTRTKRMREVTGTNPRKKSMQGINAK